MGINPENEFEDTSSLVSLEPLEIKLGISPLRLFIATDMNSKFGTPMPMSVGRLPESWLSTSEICLNMDLLKILHGMRPLRLLKSSVKIYKF